MSETKQKPSFDILSNAKSLCTDFADKQSITQILSNFTSTNQGADIICYEYGAKHESVPFLGREFRGLDGAKAYFELLSQLLSYDKMIFSEYIVDNDNMAVSVRGEAMFTWLSTNQSWEEVFTYRLKFDEVDGKIVRYEVWADSLSAYLASTGQLQQES